MNGLRNFLGGLSLGAGYMYFFDPRMGNRRRSLVRDAVARAMNKSCDALDASWRDIQHRLWGTLAEARHLVTSDQASDPVICERVRSKLGRHCSHPGSIGVTSNQGHVTLTGPILSHELDEVLSAVSQVRGVRSIENHMEVHKTAGNISGLQGGGRPPGDQIDFMQNNWAPATRVMACNTGLALMLNCSARRRPSDLLLGMLGFGLFMRGLTNMEVNRLLGFGGGRRGVDIQKTIHLDAPIDEVFNLLSNPENFPHFANNIHHVRKIRQGCYSGTMIGPAGSEIHFEEEITRLVPNDVVAWRSSANSPVAYAGIARFEETTDGGTRVHIRATYNPPGGVFTHAAAAAMGADLKSQLDDMMLRAKSYLETGKQPHDAAERTEHEATTSVQR